MTAFRKKKLLQTLISPEKLFHGFFGKTECWYILGTRKENMFDCFECTGRDEETVETSLKMKGEGEFMCLYVIDGKAWYKQKNNPGKLSRTVSFLYQQITETTGLRLRKTLRYVY